RRRDSSEHLEPRRVYDRCCFVVVQQPSSGGSSNCANDRAPAVKAIDSKYLLTGFAQCAICGGSLMARSRDYGSTRKFGYLCGYHHQRGRTVCVNGLEAPMEATDHAVLASIERDLLPPEIVERAIEFAIDELRPDSDDSRRADILAEIHRLDSELARADGCDRERRRSSGPPRGRQGEAGSPGAPGALGADADRAGRDVEDRSKRAFVSGARDPPPAGRLAGDAAARGPRGARTPPEPDRRPDRIHAPPRDSRLRVLREGVFRACPGRNDQS